MYTLAARSREDRLAQTSPKSNESFIAAEGDGLDGSNIHDLEQRGIALGSAGRGRKNCVIERGFHKFFFSAIGHCCIEKNILERKISTRCHEIVTRNLYCARH